MHDANVRIDATIHALDWVGQTLPKCLWRQDGHSLVTYEREILLVSRHVDQHNVAARPEKEVYGGVACLMICRSTTSRGSQLIAILCATC
jgi:hypothetical protein